MTETADEPVRAAGGVIRRPGKGGREQVALVHRPAYDDWTFPKGKLLPGEEWEHAALRETEEETGYRCRLGSALGSVRYVDRRGRDKVVHYWLMEALDGDFAPTREVDELRWLTLDEALDHLSYDHDRELLRSLAAVH